MYLLMYKQTHDLHRTFITDIHKNSDIFDSFLSFQKPVPLEKISETKSEKRLQSQNTKVKTRDPFEEEMNWHWKLGFFRVYCFPSW